MPLLPGTQEDPFPEFIPQIKLQQRSYSSSPPKCRQLSCRPPDLTPIDKPPTVFSDEDLVTSSAASTSSASPDAPCSPSSLCFPSDSSSDQPQSLDSSWFTHLRTSLQTNSPQQHKIPLRERSWHQKSSNRLIQSTNCRKYFPHGAPKWALEFRPRWPWTDSGPVKSRIPQATNIVEAVQQHYALSQFHFAVLLADEHSNGTRSIWLKDLAAIVEAYMPALQILGIHKHQLVFYYHGRLEDWKGNDIWDAISKLEERKMTTQRGGEKVGVNGLNTRATHGTVSVGRQIVDVEAVKEKVVPTKVFDQRVAAWNVFDAGNEKQFCES